MRNKLFLLTILVAAASLIVGFRTAPQKTERTIQEIKGTLILRDPTTVVKGLEARSLDEALRLPDDEVDLATAILLIQKKAQKDLDQIDIDIYKYRKKVDQIASSLLSGIGKEKSPEAIIRIMNHYVFEELNLSYFGEAGDTKTSFLTFVLDEKKGDCFGLSILYLSIAERIGLSLYGVTAPFHAFVRYDDHVRRINIETTDNGKTTSDRFYIDKLNVPKGSEFYLKSLRKKETIGCYLGNVGIAYFRKGQYDQAIADCNKALKINPRDAAAYTTRGVAYHKKGQYDQAIADYNKALEINPRNAEAYYNRGGAYDKAGRTKETIEALTTFILYAPASYQSYVEQARKRIKELER